MHQVIQPSKGLFWHTSGWNEKSNQKKKRKKRVIQTISINFDKLPRMKILSLMIMPIMLLILKNNLSFTDCQLVVEHPKIHAKPAYQSTFSSHLTTYPKPKTIIRFDDSENRSNVPIEDSPTPDNITNYSSLPSSRAEQHELLRKLSSTMLLDTLLRQPIMTNKSPFPPLTMLNNLSPVPVNSTMDVSATNRTTVTDSHSTDLDNFNASSLHYLVDKLIKTQALKQDIIGKRPSRRKSPYENVEAIPEQNIKFPATLDVLIRDEYDSRVEPMLKSLMDQRRLTASTPIHKSNSSLNNHRLDQVFDNDISATTTPSNVDRRKNNQDNPEPMHTTNPSIRNTLIAFEELEDVEDDEEFDDELDENSDVNREGAKTTSEPKSKTKLTDKSNDRKALQNVPPYQFGNSFGHETGDKRYPALNSSQPEIQTTTMSSVNRKNVPIPVFKEKKKISNSNEKVTDASLRDSLVFSDGADEDRANRRKNQSTQTNITDDTGPSSASKKRKGNVGKIKNPSINRFNERGGESSFLLDLFSSINPLTDLDKLKEPYNQKDMNDRNPLIYKGYVGSNDYMLSSTARDWSRPLNNRDPTSLYKYLQNNQQNVETTPATPLSEPPTQPFSYISNQPVTNAQSVPTMVIPTSDPPEMTTTPQPVIAGFDSSRRKTPFPDPQYGGTSRPQNNSTQPHHQAINVFLHNPSLKPLDRQQIYSNHDRKYSYQVPDRSQNKTRHQQVKNHMQQPNLSSEFFKPLLNHTSESPELIDNNGVKNGTSSSKFSTIVEVDRNWSPSKIIQNPQQDHKRLRVQFQNTPDNILLPVLGPSSPVNLSSPMLVPFVGMKGFGSTPLANTIHSPAKISPNDVSTVGIETVPASTSPPTMRPAETTAKPTSTTVSPKELGDHQERPLQKNSTLTERRSNNSQRKKLKAQKKETTQEPSVTNSSETDDVSGDSDRDSEQIDDDNHGGGSRKSKKSTSKPRDNNEKSDIDDSDLEDDYQGESSESSDERITTTQRPRKQHKDRTRVSNGDSQQGTTKSDQLNEELKQNQTKKAASYTTKKHDVAGSEISYMGFDKNLHQPITHRRNQSSRFVGHKQQPPQVNTETIALGGSEGDGVSYKPATVSESSVPTSFGSTIIPNSNFVGEASSDSPTLDNSIPAILNGRPSGKFQRQPVQITAAPDDPYQRISSSNNIVSTVIQPSSKIVTTTNAPKLLDLSSTTEIYRKQEDTISSNSKSANEPVPTKPTSKGSSDRLAFILICGSCFLSVVCLVLAAMSVRCPDMFDDYRYMRNAERAALRLQKHRLRYTKNHEINRYSDDGLSPENGVPNLIDDLNLQTPGAAVAEPELNNMRNSTKCLNSRPAQFNRPHCKNTSDGNAMWNPPSVQQPLPAVLNKEQQACRCANCSNQRWSVHQEDLMAANKHLSWLHPYFYMQNHARLRPLFGAGSSVGTFFPRRMDDQKLHTAGGSIDAQILIDSQPPHSCGIIDQRGATRSKSILNTNKRPLNQRHVNGLEVSQHDNSNFGCNNPAHSHSHHNCHNHGDHHHHLHNHRCNLETSTSDDSELTIDESFHHCDSAKCSAHHQKAALNNRLKLNQLRSVDVGHAHHSAVWKPRSFRKSTQSSHHHHHHHPQVSSSEASSSVQCTCSKDLQPLLQANSNARRNNSHRTSHKRLLKHDTNFKQAKRDKSMLIWSSNLDRLI